jgi:uncharacterized RDD family membrane protein YckC
LNEYRYLSPEKVYLKLNLAGIGSRFAACFIDGIFSGLIVAFIAIVFTFFGTVMAKHFVTQWLVAILIVVAFIVGNAYFIVFETIWNGQTPGKRFIKLRVVQVNGASVTFMMVLIRNLLRVIDGLPISYGIGILSVCFSGKNQRIGDLAAGTVVIRECTEEAPLPLNYEMVATSKVVVNSINVRRIEEADFAVLKKYLMRRENLKPEERINMELKLVEFFCRKLDINPAEIEDVPEFLKQIASIGSQGAGDKRSL